MAYVTENTYTGDNSTVLFSFTFPYLEKTDVKVSIDQVDTTAFTFANATQIQLNSASGTNGKTIRIYRDTNIDDLKAEFFSGSAIRSQDLNEDFRQNLYNSQETEAAVELKWNKTTDTLDSTEAFVDSNNYLMTAAAIDDRINTNIGSQALADGKILAGNGSGVAAAVTPSGDVTMANTGAFTIGTGAVEHDMLAGDCVDGDNIGDNVINSEHYADASIDNVHLSNNAVTTGKIAAGTIVNDDISGSASIDHSKIAAITSGQILMGNSSNVPTATAVSGDVTLANDGTVTIANDAIDSEHYADASIDNRHLANDAVTTDKILAGTIINADISGSASIDHSKIAAITDGHIIVGSGSNVPTAVAVSGDVTIANTGAVTIANDAVEIGMIGCEQTTISDSDSHIPTSGAVVDYVAAQIAPIGGLEVIADDESFPNTIAPAGVVISITDAAGLQVNSSGVSTNADTLDNSTVTINGFPSELRGGVGSNADPYVFQSGAGLMVKSTGSSQTYDYHQALIRESDFVQLSDDINDFNSRYVVHNFGSGNPSSPDEGDLAFDTNANKMKVYDGSSWGEVTSTGDFKYLVMTNPGTTNAATLTNSTFDLKETSTSGSAAAVTSAAQLIVSVNGVIQKANTGTSAPAEGFALSDADTIVFSSAPGSGASVFIIQIGSAVSIPTPGDGTVSATKIAAGAVIAAKIGTGAVEHAKLAADCVDGDNLADNACDSEHYTDGSVDIVHLANGTDGKIITWDANGAATVVGPGTDGQVLTSTGAGSPPAFEDVPAGGIASLVADTSPQLGGDLDTNGNNIDFDDSKKARFGASEDLRIYHHGGHSYVQNDTGTLYLNTTTTGESVTIGASGKICIKAIIDGAVELSHNEVKQCETSANGLAFPSGKGIDFSATADSAATGATDTSELFADYEEGTWTPVLNHGTCTPAQAYYVRCGNMVWVTAAIGNMSDRTTDGEVRVVTASLPFNTNISYNNIGVCRHRYTSHANVTLAAIIDGNGIYFGSSDEAFGDAAYHQLHHDEIDATYSEIAFSGWYRTAA